MWVRFGSGLAKPGETLLARHLIMKSLPGFSHGRHQRISVVPHSPAADTKPQPVSGASPPACPSRPTPVQGPLSRWALAVARVIGPDPSVKTPPDGGKSIRRTSARRADICCSAREQPMPSRRRGGPATASVPTSLRYSGY